MLGTVAFKNLVKRPERPRFLFNLISPYSDRDFFLAFLSNFIGGAEHAAYNNLKRGGEELKILAKLSNLGRPQLITFEYLRAR